MNDTLIQVVADVLQLAPERVVDTLAMDDVATWDSLKHMELIAGLEEAFRIELTFDEIVAMQSVGDIRRVLQARGTTG